MKSWIMPKIIVEGFAPNEYVAACAEMAGLFTNANYYDFDGNTVRPFLVITKILKINPAPRSY